jgi:hypothetical protein
MIGSMAKGFSARNGLQNNEDHSSNVGSAPFSSLLFRMFGMKIGVYFLT